MEPRGPAASILPTSAVVSEASVAAHSVFLIGEFGQGRLGLYYARAFQALHWQVVCYDAWAGYARPRLLKRSRVLRRVLRPFLWAVMCREVVHQVRRSRVELVIVFKGAFLGLKAVQCLKSAAGVPVVNVYPDSPYDRWTLRANVVRVLSEFDRIYIWGKHLVPRLRKDGVPRATYLPFGYDPDDYHPRSIPWKTQCGKTHAVVFIGQRYPKREEWLSALADLDLGIWGHGWLKSSLTAAPRACIHKERIHGPEVGAVYSRARVAINVLHDSNMPGHNMRTFEIPACGTVMVTEATDEIEGFFPVGRACLAASNPIGLRQEVERALADPLLANAIADQGLQLARVHTYVARVATILADLGFAETETIAQRAGQ